MANPERCCAMCHHCLKGIPFDKKYFLCFACDELAICTSCHKRHPKSHLPWMKVATDKATLRDAAMETHRKCMHCGTTAHARIDCNACEGTACFDCYADNRELWGDHTHKAYTYTRAPDDFNAPSFDRDCLSCTLGASMGHCSHCLEGIMEGDRVYECKTCLAKWNSTPSVCEACLPTIKRSHDTTHTWVYFVYREIRNAVEKHKGFQCLDCDEDMNLASNWLQEHPHTNFQIGMGSIERQEKAHKAMRLCPKRDVSNIDRAPESLHDGAMGCHCCWTKFEKNAKTYYCTKCSYSSCVACHESGKSNHPHPEIIKLDMVIITPPSDFWRSILAGRQRFCDECKESFWPDIQTYIQCNRCKDFDICQQCIENSKCNTTHASCPNSSEWTYYDQVKMEEDWLDEQIATAKAHKAEEEAEAERQQQAVEAERKRKADEAARAAAAAQRTRLASTQGAQLKVTPAPASKLRGLSPAPPRTSSSHLAPAPPKPAQRRKSSSGLGSALLSLGKVVLKAEVSAMNAANNANNGGFGGGGGGGFSNFSSNDNSAMNMNSFWQPINDAASDPIQ